jgi:hypothetical protein
LTWRCAPRPAGTLLFWGADERRLGWAGPRPTTASMVADTSLWRGLLNDARARFPHIVTQEVWRRRYALIDTIGDWHKAKDTLPATLAHNDFNQRNVGFRRNGHAPEPAPEPVRNGAAKSNRRSHRFLPQLFGSKKSHADPGCRCCRRCTGAIRGLKQAR